MTKIILSNSQMEDLLDFIKPNKNLPEITANSIVEINKNKLKQQLKNLKIHPNAIQELKEIIKRNYFSSQIQPGESVGVLTSVCIGERNTQSTLNTFHHAGITEKTVVTGVPRFEELINATKTPKAVSATIYFLNNNKSIRELRNYIKYSIVELNLAKLALDVEININKKSEPWYEPFALLYGDEFKNYSNCITFKLNKKMLYEYQLTLKDIATSLENEYNDITCVFSPPRQSQLDVFIDTKEVNIEEEILYINSENAEYIYIEEVVQPIIETYRICGIQGISSIYYMENNGEWYVETDGSNLKEILAQPNVDITRTRSNNVWEIYNVFGIQATKQALFNEFMELMSGINSCHAKLLVDWMTHSGTIASISRYTVKKEDCGPLSKCSFEETLSNLISAGIYTENENTNGVSASIICGKRSKIGSGFCDIKMDLEMLEGIEDDE